ncbi:MAG: transglutaminase-like domain-containing protein, partial [Planctomycetes bacterium]|nr:transglutaminase-like domain-containing protein [Planctomycetota bacterium]
KAVKRSFSAFSDQQQQFVKASFELTGVSQHRHGEQTLDVYDVALTRGDGVNMTGKVDKDNMMVTGTIMGMMQLEWVDEPPFDFEGKGANIDSTYDVACAIKDWRELESMSLTLTLKNDADETPLLADNHYHKVTRKDGRYELELKPTRLPDTFRPLMLPMNAPDEVAPFLKATPNCQSDHEDIKKQAKDIVGDKTNSLDAARAIVDWVGKHFNRVSAGSRGNASALEALKSKDGDCSEHAALTVALARASGIPARTVAGMEYVYHKNKAIVGFHAWAEVYVGQWVAVDATIPETGTSARYIFFGYTEPGHDGGESKITRCMGGMDVEVTRYKCFGKDVVAPPIEQPAKKAANKKKATKK